MSEPIHIISLGAGVQSSTMALMAAAGEITPMPVAAIFADTKWERKKTYAWLAWLTTQLPFPVHIVSKGNLRRDNIEARCRGHAVDGLRWASLPYFTKVDGKNEIGKIKRQCTAEYKIEPIEKFTKSEILGLIPHARLPKEAVVIQWRGISSDEPSRIKDSTQPWYKTRFPLALELGMSRNDCAAWLWKRYQKVAPRSACIGCPFHRDSEWRDIRDNDPDEWIDAVEFDRSIRKAGGMRGDSFLHRSCKPLDQVDFSTEEERGQLNMFNNECEGMCGV